MRTADGPFPAGFFDRQDDSADSRFYRQPRLVTHIDDGAIEAVADLYAELGVDGGRPAATSPPDASGPPAATGRTGERRRVLDLMSSWISHLRTPPAELVVLGMNTAELDANAQATERVVQDLNADPRLPFPDFSFDAVLCCVSIDYLVRPVEVLAEAARVLRPGAPAVLTFSNRLFPTKAVRGWLQATEDGRCAIAAEYLRQAGGFTEPEVSLRTPPGFDRGGRYPGDPLYAVVARAL